MAAVTVKEALDLDVIRSAGPEVLAGEGGLDRPVRWVHVTELADIAPLVRSGDLLLSTGIALPESAQGLRDFAASLTDSGVAGIVIELGRRWTTVPPALVDACRVLELPLVALHHEVRFAVVAQALGERIVDQQLGELREAQEVHETFTELSNAEAGPRQILEAVQRLAGATVVLEGADHEVVDFRPGPSGATAFVADWSRRSKAVRIEARTDWDRLHGWLVSGLGRRERGWGRLVIQSPTEPSQRLIAVIERGAAALAMHRLQDGHRSSQVRRTHLELVSGLLHDPADTELQRRCELAGFPVTKHQYIALAVRPVVDGTLSRAAALEEVMAAAVHAAHTTRVPALVCDTNQVARILLAVRSAADPDAAADALALAVGRTRSIVVGAGRAVAPIGAVDRTLRESVHVLSSIGQPDPDQPVHRLEDVHLRGLLALLGGDDRLQLFVERELETLRAHDERWDTDHLAVLRALLEHPASKSEAAASLGLSRPVFYDRIAKIGRLLKVDLDHAQMRTSLHVALMAADILDAESGE